MFIKRKKADSTEKKRRKFSQLSKKKRNLLIVVLVAAIAGGSYFGYAKIFQKDEASADKVARVTRGNIAKSIEGTGTISAINQYEVTSLVKGEILEDYFTEGQEINKGDLMYTIDSEEMNNSIEKAKTSLEKAQDSYQQALENDQKTTANERVTAPISGVITNVYVADGDTVQNGAKVLDIVNTDEMILKIKFNANDARNIHVGDSATVNMENSFTSLPGRVTSVSSGSIANSAGVSVSNLEITVSNPGGIVPNNRATAVVGSYACNEAGTFSYSASKTVVTKASGEIYGLQYKEGDYIKNGATILRLDDDNNSGNSLKQSRLSVKDAQLALDNLYQQLENYSIKAPISGKVIQKTSKAGEKLDNSNNNTVMAIIADLSTLTFEISVDELDISSIQVGQSVEITADAITGKTFGGYVENISIVGTSANGVTSYPVKVYVNDGEGEELIPGMNVSAKIVTDSRENVLTVPLSAVNRGNTVLVKRASGTTESKHSSAEGKDAVRQEQPPQDGQPLGNGEAPQGMPDADGKSGKDSARSSSKKAGKSNIPEGYEMVTVEIGLNDDTNVEIISGLQEGDTVLLNETTANTTKNNEQNQQGMGGMPGGGGGMPGGGMPGGGGGGAPGGMGR